MRIDVLVMSVFSVALLVASAYLANESVSFAVKLWPVYLYGVLVMVSLAMAITVGAATILQKSANDR